MKQTRTLIPVGEQSVKVTSYPSSAFDDELIKEASQQTAVDFYIDKMNEWFEDAAVHCGLNKHGEIYKQAKQMENDRRKEDYKIGYNQGYLDALGSDDSMFSPNSKTKNK